MRNTAAVATHGTGKSRSKPLHRRSIKNIMIQQRGYQKLDVWLAHVIKKTAAPVKVHMKGIRFAVKQGIKSIAHLRHHGKTATTKKKLQINKGLK